MTPRTAHQETPNPYGSTLIPPFTSRPHAAFPERGHRVPAGLHRAKRDRNIGAAAGGSGSPRTRRLFR